MIKINIDLRNSLKYQFFKLISGPLLLIIIPLFINSIDQGYWFTFVSIGSISMLADLGMTTIVLQFSAHEFSKLSKNEFGILYGERNDILRFKSFILFIKKRALKISFIILPVMFITGYVLFESKNDENNYYWLMPWILFCIGSTLTFVLNIFLALFEGCDNVSVTQDIRFNTLFVFVVICLSLLFFSFSLYSLAFATLLSNLYGLYLLMRNYQNSFQIIFSESKCKKIEWKKEIYPLLKRYSLSWMFGFLVFPILVPIVFHYYGPEYAGTVGLSLSIATSIFTLSSVWLNINLPKININIAKENYNELDIVFNKSFLFTIITFVLLIFAFFTAIKFPFLQNLTLRILDSSMLLQLFLIWFFQLIVNGLSMYVRSHKKEPFMIMSIINGIFVLIVTVVVSNQFPFEYIFTGYLLSFIITIPWSYSIFNKFRTNHE